jgi:hypothetical protein
MPSGEPTRVPTVTRRRLSTTTTTADGHLRGVARRLAETETAVLAWTANVADIQQFGYEDTSFDENGEPVAAGDMFRDMILNIKDSFDSGTYLVNLQSEVAGSELAGSFNDVTSAVKSGSYEYAATVTRFSSPTPQPTAFAPTVYPTSQPSTEYARYSINTSPTTDEYIAWLPIASAADHLGVLLCIVAAIAGCILTLYLVTAHNTKIANLVMLEERRYSSSSSLAIAIALTCPPHFLTPTPHHPILVYANAATKRRETNFNDCPARARPPARPHLTSRIVSESTDWAEGAAVASAAMMAASTGAKTWWTTPLWAATVASLTTAVEEVAAAEAVSCVLPKGCGKPRTPSCSRWCTRDVKLTFWVARHDSAPFHSRT